MPETTGTHRFLPSPHLIAPSPYRATCRKKARRQRCTCPFRHDQYKREKYDFSLHSPCPSERNTITCTNLNILAIATSLGTVKLYIQLLRLTALPVDIQPIIKNIVRDISRKPAAVHIKRLLAIEFMNPSGPSSDLHIAFIRTVCSAITEFFAQYTADAPRQKIDILLPDMNGIAGIVIPAIDMKKGQLELRLKKPVIVPPAVIRLPAHLNICPVSAETPYPQFEKSPCMYPARSL